MSLATKEQLLAERLGVELQIIKGLSLTQLGWLDLEKKKSIAASELEKFELSVQAIINSVIEVKDTIVTGLEKDLPKVQEAIKKAKKIYDEQKDCRVQFTNMIDERLVKELMKPENRSKALVGYAEKYELDLRLEVNKKSDEESALKREVASFTTHVTNEYYRMATEYRNALKEEISKTYVGALSSGMPIEGVPDLVASLKETIKGFKLSKFVVFTRTLINDEKAKEVFLSIPAYKSAGDLEAAILEADEMFSMYANDLENAKEISDKIIEETKLAVSENNEKLDLEKSTNILLNQASSFVLTGSSSGKTRVKKSLNVVVYETEDWERAVLTNFIKNWKFLRGLVKSSSVKMSIGQMAVAIGKFVTDKPDEKKNMTGLEFTEKSK